MIIRWLALLALLVLVATPAAAQILQPVPVPTPPARSWRIQFDQAAVDMPTVAALTFAAYLDGAVKGKTKGAPLMTVCVLGPAATLPQLWTCTADLPSMSIAPHKMTITASNAAGESEPSPELSFSLVVIPASPASIRILPPLPAPGEP